MTGRRIMLALFSTLLMLLGGSLPRIAAGAGDGTAVALRPVEDPGYGIRSVVPEAWQPFGPGIHARGRPPEDVTLIALQSAPLSADQLWAQLLPQLVLTEVPEASGARSTAALDWTLYAIDVDLPGMPLAVQLAVAEEGGTTYLVLLQSTPAEAAALRAQVFEPALDAFEPLAPEPTPDPASLGYGVEEVSFPGGAPEVRLAGTLTTPRGPGPHPVIVLMSGSGPQDRDESLRPITSLKPFALIADALTRAGVAVLRYDDRGVGASTGDHAAATLADLTSDGRAAIDYLEARADVDPGRIGMLGHSEGAIYAATLAATDPRVAWVVALAPPAVDGVSLLASQAEAIARASGQPEVEVAAGRALVEAAYPAALAGDIEALETALRDAFGAYWDRQADDVRAVLGARDAFVQRQVDTQVPQVTSAWFRSLLAADPRPDWSRVRVPALAIFAGLDTQVPVELNEPAWRAALEAAGNEDATSFVIDDANHLFQAAVSGAPAEYGRLAPAFSEAFLPALVGWLAGRAGLAP